MTEGIVWHTEGPETGLVDITFGDKTYRLNRPGFSQWKHYQETLDKMRRAANDRVADILRRAAEADKAHAEKPTKKTEAAVEAIKAESAAFRDDPYYEHTSVLLAEMFAELGDPPLPEDRDTWPAWLVTDTTIPIQIITTHWNHHPKVSGPVTAM